MKLKYPAEAFALGIVLFSAGMKEAFAAGILVIFSAVFAELLKNLLETALPGWSLRLCVYIASGSACASAFLVGFAALGTALSAGVWIMTFVVGLLCARHALSGGAQAEYGELLFEGALAWGFWILLAIVREFSGSGAVFGNTILKASFQSKALMETTFAFLAAGLVLALVNGILKKDCRGLDGRYVVVPAAILSQPFVTDFLSGNIGVLWAIVVTIALFLSVRRTLAFSRAGRALRGLPVEMLAAGFVYMILSIY
ncbi:MAG: hypothetical protein Q4C82_08770 [Eubacteriales bacterium]|nr:hypothetical protein [Eubacteriales bacterium]